MQAGEIQGQGCPGHSQKQPAPPPCAEPSTEPAFPSVGLDVSWHSSAWIVGLGLWGATEMMAR